MYYEIKNNIFLLCRFPVDVGVVFGTAMVVVDGAGISANKPTRY